MATKTVMSYDGTQEVNIENYQKSLIDFPAEGIRQHLDNDGVAALCGVCYTTTPCGCEIVGCGTLQFPLTIRFCQHHCKPLAAPLEAIDSPDRTHRYPL